MKPYQLWYDLKRLNQTENPEALVPLILNGAYTNLLVDPDSVHHLALFKSSHIPLIYAVDSISAYETFLESPEVEAMHAKHTLCSEQLSVLNEARSKGIPTCYKASAHDERSLVAAIEQAKPHDYLLIGFPDPTNIPLELVIAKLQRKTTQIIKYIDDQNDVDDARVVYSVMEVGADGATFSPTSPSMFEIINQHVQNHHPSNVQVQTGTIIASRPVGVGYRSCIDLATLFQPAVP